MIDNQTNLYFSASARPGNLGAQIYNLLFKKFNINAVYLPREINNARKLIDAIKILNVCGCSISMPLKSKVVRYMNNLDEISKETDSVNTILNKNGVLHGYNTDYYGLLDVIAPLRSQSILIYGAGSVANSVVLAAKNSLCEKIFITARRSTQAKQIATKFGIEYIVNKKIYDSQFDLLINATPASIEKNHEIHMFLPYVKTIFDLVVSPTKTELVKKAEKRGCQTIQGIEMSKKQIKRQFEIYTSINCEQSLIDDLVESFYKRDL